MAVPVDHAGLSEGKLNLIVFENAEQLAALLSNIGIKTREGVVLAKDGSQETCKCCGDGISLTNLGNVMPGSLLVFCDDPFCLTPYIAEHLAEEAAGA